jgi:hypothetical protein
MSLGLPLEDFAAAIGVQLPQDDSLMPVVEEMLLCGLPEGWTEHLSSKGTVYFYNEALDVNQAEDPRVTSGRRRILEIKSNAAAMSTSESSGDVSAVSAAAAARDSVVLEEELPENYEPTEEEILEYASWLEMDVEREKDSDVMLSLYAAIDSARSDLAQKEDQASSVTRQLQTATFRVERERAAAAAAEARRANLVEVMQQLDEETQVST